METGVQQKVVDHFTRHLCMQVESERKRTRVEKNLLLDPRIQTDRRQKKVSLSLSPAPKRSKLEKKKGEEEGI